MGKHFILASNAQRESFRARVGGGGGRTVPAQDRSTHGASLRAQLAATSRDMDQARANARVDDEVGLTIAFESFAGVELAIDSLERERSGIELRSVRRDGDTTIATVFVPDGKLAHFERLIGAYLSARVNTKGEARDNRPLLDTIQRIRTATLRSMWADDIAAFPPDEDVTVWWEVWLPGRRERDASIAAFRNLCAPTAIVVARGELTFPERTVLVVRASARELARVPGLLSMIAEVRRAKDTADTYDSMAPKEQAEWVAELLARAIFPRAGDDTPHICILDTGVNRGHPLLVDSLDAQDLHTIEPGWGTDDGTGHGTCMAGLALLGDLTPLLLSGAKIVISSRLESVKLIEHNSGNTGDSRTFGYNTRQAVAQAEIAAPFRRRIVNLAVTAEDGRDEGRPSAWSASIDGLAASVDAPGTNSRLIVVAGGNAGQPALYPAGNSTDSIHDPGQAWNALTVGAYTALTRITETGAESYTPLAAAGGLSPYSTTSARWGSVWPLKPDVVFEGGNLAKDGTGSFGAASLSLLTTHHEPMKRVFTTAHATSAACALASRMASEIGAAYPTLRPETVRALIVQSAEWTDAMQAMYLPANGSRSKTDWARLVRHCGFGVPNTTRALQSVANSLTLIVEDSVVPFDRQTGRDVTLNEMCLHALPWPEDELLSLGELPVEMRVTISYFIEPNPSARAPSSRYRYESHGLRFDVRRATESTPAFRQRINRAAHDDEGATATAESDNDWLIGKNARHRGSIHSDIWRGTAADLARRGVLAVYPSAGWWKTRQALNRWNSVARYSLVVSIRTPEVATDLYAAIETKIATAVDVRV
jgi:Subtilase family